MIEWMNDKKNIIRVICRKDSIIHSTIQPFKSQILHLKKAGKIV